ncbi:MAG: hypothetical protein JWN78_3081 [Bacteroidota bacterium]|nr:hypothetical protein [Bacteroidota bacterium]
MLKLKPPKFLLIYINLSLFAAFKKQTQFLNFQVIISKKKKFIFLGSFEL